MNDVIDKIELLKSDLKKAIVEREKNHNVLSYEMIGIRLNEIEKMIGECECLNKEKKE